MISPTPICLLLKPDKRPLEKIFSPPFFSAISGPISLRFHGRVPTGGSHRKKNFFWFRKNPPGGRVRFRPQISPPNNSGALGATGVRFSGKTGLGTLCGGFERRDAPVNTFSARGRQTRFWLPRGRRSFRVPMGPKNTGPGFLGQGMSERVHLLLATLPAWGFGSY